MHRACVFEWRKSLFGGCGAQRIGEIEIKHGKQIVSKGGSLEPALSYFAMGCVLRQRRRSGLEPSRTYFSLNRDCYETSQDIKRFFIRTYFSVKSDEWLYIDAKVLNSVVHLPKAIPCFERHATIEVGIQSILKIFCDER